MSTELIVIDERTLLNPASVAYVVREPAQLIIYLANPSPAAMPYLLARGDDVERVWGDLCRLAAGCPTDEARTLKVQRETLDALDRIAASAATNTPTTEPEGPNRQ